MTVESRRGVVLRSEWPRPSVSYLVGTVWFFAAIWAAVAAISFILGGTGNVSVVVLVILYVYVMRFAVTYDLRTDCLDCRNNFATISIPLRQGTTLTHLRRAPARAMLSFNQTFRRYERLIELRDEKGRRVLLTPSAEFTRELEDLARGRGVTIMRSVG